MSQLHVPATGTEARALGLDLNGDKTVDNMMGQIFSTLANTDLGVAGSANEALLRGGLIMLADLQTTNFEDTTSTGLTMYLGRDPVPAPCLDPASLDTCGRHLQGGAQISVGDSSASDLAIAPIKNGVFIASMSRLPVEIVIEPTSPIRLDLHGAKVRWTALGPDHASAILAGGITRADVDGVVIPAAAVQMDRIVVDECGQGGSELCGCLDGSRARSLQYHFDKDNDCRITSTELAASNLVRSLTAPDLRVGGEELLSFGLGVELVSATFSPP